jgi:hypothetical protein
MPTWGDGVIGPDVMLWWRGVSLGTIETQLLSEMVRTLGPEKFGQFWRSNESPAVAFKAATGVSLGEWTHNLLVKTYGDQHLGPGVETAGVGMGLLLIALGAGLAMVCSQATHLRLMRVSAQDIRRSARTLAKHRGFTIVAVASLALAIALNTTMYSVIDALVNPKIELREPDRLYRLFYYGDLRRRLQIGDVERTLRSRRPHL